MTNENENQEQEIDDAYEQIIAEVAKSANMNLGDLHQAVAAGIEESSQYDDAEDDDDEDDVPED
jgi:hypothetical protein